MLEGAEMARVFAWLRPNDQRVIEPGTPSGIVVRVVAVMVVRGQCLTV